MVNQAALLGNRKILEWLMEMGCPVLESPRALSGCASGGHIENLFWLHDEKGAPWTGGVTNALANRGDLETLKVVHEQGCPLSDFAAAAAARTGNVELLRWLLEQGVSDHHI